MKERYRPTVSSDFSPSLDLWSALRLIVHHMAEDGPRLAGMMYSPRWAFYDHPTSVQGTFGNGSIRAFLLARVAEEEGRKRLRGWLIDGKIRGTGAHVGERRSIDEAWSTHFIDWANSALLNPMGHTPAEFPPFKAVRVNRDDVIRECTAASAPPPSTHGTTGGPAKEAPERPGKSRGMQPAIRQAVKDLWPDGRLPLSHKERDAAIRKHLGSGEERPHEVTIRRALGGES